MSVRFANTMVLFPLVCLVALVLTPNVGWSQSMSVSSKTARPDLSGAPKITAADPGVPKEGGRLTLRGTHFGT